MQPSGAVVGCEKAEMSMKERSLTHFDDSQTSHYRQRLYGPLRAVWQGLAIISLIDGPIVRHSP